MAGQALFLLFALITLIVFLPSGMISARLARSRGRAEPMLWYAEEDERGHRRITEVPASVAPWIESDRATVAAAWFRSGAEAVGGDLGKRSG